MYKFLCISFSHQQLYPFNRSFSYEIFVCGCNLREEEERKKKKREREREKRDKKRDKKKVFYTSDAIVLLL